MRSLLPHLGATVQPQSFGFCRSAGERRNLWADTNARHHRSGPYCPVLSLSAQDFGFFGGDFSIEHRSLLEYRFHLEDGGFLEPGSIARCTHLSPTFYEPGKSIAVS